MLPLGNRGTDGPARRNEVGEMEPEAAVPPAQRPELRRSAVAEPGDGKWRPLGTALGTPPVLAASAVGFRPPDRLMQDFGKHVPTFPRDRQRFGDRPPWPSLA